MDWISVKDRLPADRQGCLVWARDTWSGNWYFHIDKWCGDGWLVCSPECDYTVTHWMPLPEPPEV